MFDEPIPHSKLPTLDAVLDQKQMEPILTAVLANHEQLAAIDQLNATILQHRSKRCVIRYEMTLDDGTAVNYIGKVYQLQKHGQPIYERMQTLWQEGFHRYAQDHIHIPEPVAFIPELSLLIQEEIPGEPVKDHVRRSGGRDSMRQLAQGLIKLHTCNIQLGPPFRIEDHLMRCHPKYQVLSIACPELRDDIECLIETACQLEALVSEEQFTPIHGDFHLSQVHIQRHQSWMLDFDPMSFGDPAADLGNLLVLLKSKSRKWGNVPMLIDSFLDEYFSVMDHSIAGRIPLYEATTHLRRACKKLRYQTPNWQQDIQHLINKGLKCLQQVQLVSA